MKSTAKPLEILANLNKMADYALDQEIDLYEVCAFSFLFDLFSSIWLDAKKIMHGCYIQEIKFEPNIICDPVDKQVSFRASQV